MPRPKAGGYNWRSTLVDLIRNERSEMDVLTRLLQASATPETGNLIRQLIENKLDRIVQLYELHGYKRDPADPLEELYGAEESER